MRLLDLPPAALMAQRLTRREDFADVLWRLPGERWHEIQRLALTRALTAALASPFHQRQTLPRLDRQKIRRDPLAALLHFPPLTKEVYWKEAEALRLPGYARQLRFRFHTSGTETGVPTEMPWDGWSYRKSFAESSAFALTAAVAPAGGLALIGAPGIGALGRAFAWAGRHLGLRTAMDASSFNERTVVRRVERLLRRNPGAVLIGAPGPLVFLLENLREAGVDTRELGVKAVISGIGTYLDDRHLAFLVERLAPDWILEQGGKNEILHAPGALRYRRPGADPGPHGAQRGAGICPQGFLHYLPWSSHVVAVDAEAFRQGELVPIGHGRRGVLLMSRLSAGRRGIVAYLNDAADFGETREIGVGAELCPCGNSMPAFRFGGRVLDCVDNKLGLTLFPEEWQQALRDACRLAAVPAQLAATLRLQMVLVRDAEWTKADTLYWLLGVEPAALADPNHRATLELTLRRLLRCWAWSTSLGNRYDSYMVFGGGRCIPRAALPHSGRDKAQYRAVLGYEAAAGENHAAALERYLRERLHTEALTPLVPGELP